MTTSTYLALDNVWIAKPTPSRVERGQQFVQDSAYVVPTKSQGHHVDPTKQVQVPLAVKLSTP
jgi:hypothetical protein